MANGAAVPVKPDSARLSPTPRAFPSRMEILTEHGFYDFSDLNNQDLFEGEVAHETLASISSRSTGALPFYNLYATNENFPRVASVDPSTGQVGYVRPSLFRVFEYQEKLVQLKMKGVDVAGTEFAEYWLKGRYGRTWRFVSGNSIVRNGKVDNSYYFLNDKFNQSLYGEYEPLQGLQADFEHPIQLFPARHGKRIDTDTYTGEKAEMRVGGPLVYNVDVAPYHTIVIRKGRKDSNPRTPWVGNPVVAGDGYDKSNLLHDQLRGLATPPLGRI